VSVPHFDDPLTDIGRRLPQQFAVAGWVVHDSVAAVELLEDRIKGRIAQSHLSP